MSVRCTYLQNFSTGEILSQTDRLLADLTNTSTSRRVMRDDNIFSWVFTKPLGAPESRAFAAAAAVNHRISHKLSAGIPAENSSKKRRISSHEVDLEIEDLAARLAKLRLKKDSTQNPSPPFPASGFSAVTSSTSVPSHTPLPPVTFNFPSTTSSIPTSSSFRSDPPHHHSPEKEHYVQPPIDLQIQDLSMRLEVFDRLIKNSK